MHNVCLRPKLFSCMMVCTVTLILNVERTPSHNCVVCSFATVMRQLLWLTRNACNLPWVLQAFTKMRFTMLKAFCDMTLWILVDRCRDVRWNPLHLIFRIWELSCCCIPRTKAADSSDTSINCTVSQTHKFVILTLKNKPNLTSHPFCNWVSTTRFV